MPVSHFHLSDDVSRLVPDAWAAGPGDDDDDDDDAGKGGGGSGGNIDPDDDEEYEEDDEDDEEPLQVLPVAAGQDARANKSRCTAPNDAIMVRMRRPASFDGCPPQALPDPGNRIIGF